MAMSFVSPPNQLTAPNPQNLFRQSPPPAQTLPMQTGGSKPQGPQEEAGVGLYFKIDQRNRYYVEMVLPDSSAAATGVVQPGDVLELVQNQTVIGTTLTQLRTMILGKPGTYVNLSFLRQKETEAFRFDVDLLRGDPSRYGAEMEMEKEETGDMREAPYGVVNHQDSNAQALRNLPQPPPPPEPFDEGLGTLPPQGMMGGIPAGAGLPGGTGQSDDMKVLFDAAERDRDSFRKKFLAEQRLHKEVERELKDTRQQRDMLKGQINQIASHMEDTMTQSQNLQSAGVQVTGDGELHIEPSAAQKAGYVPIEMLQEAETKAKNLEYELAKASEETVSRSSFLELEAKAKRLEATLAQSVSREDHMAMEAKVKTLEEEVTRQVVLSQTNSVSEDSYVQRLSVMALPAAVSALHQLSHDTGHASSATWALLRAEDYIAHLASSRCPLSVQTLVGTLVNPTTLSASHDAVLAMSIISWDPEGRKLLLDNGKTVPALLSLLSTVRHADGSLLQGHMAPLPTSDADDSQYINTSEDVLCARFAAMTLGNFSLGEYGRGVIHELPEAMAQLVDAVRGTDSETSSFALLCIGNLFMLDDARTSFRACPGACENMAEALHSKNTMTVRFAVGAVRNFAADRPCREAMLGIPGCKAVLQDLAHHSHPRVRDHAEHALYNLSLGDGQSSARDSLQSNGYAHNLSARDVGQQGPNSDTNVNQYLFAPSY